ncbi:flagellar biosynthesis protein FlhB [Salinivibrio sp. KP-1]|uniref:flagellar biosynthesis protein FlhB n=1 Tax=Salinivibrio sp. KP-1 TaxID=1406902 RepID=UPI000614663B|nr:flagellar biosynthesis protein FlhB [Salinivibrio sp. KP-1]KKA44429.1 flagellar biosynthesis protein FlhB [Salinivibrio sp. KP-1]
MAESDGQERTEYATPRRQEQAREKGQVPRSRELASVAVLVVGAISLMWFGQALGEALMALMTRLFSLSRAEIFDSSELMLVVVGELLHLILPLGLILIVLFISGLVGAAGLGGVSFSWEAARPKLSKMSPLSGFKRMFGTQGLVELLKSVLKVLLVAGVAAYLVYVNLEDFFELTIDTFPSNLYHALDILLNFVLLVCCSLLVVVVIDVPFQIWQHNEQLKMTKQEVKDEHKETEGSPEVKGRIRMLQREMAQRRMMADVPQADVVVTNPEHYSVALRYNSDIDSAPVVIAKGSDFTALKIREIAAEYDIAIVPAPPLARALYFSTELEQQIPDGLFTAVAQVLAYVFQLKQYKKGRDRRPTRPDDAYLPIPSDLQHD